MKLAIPTTLLAGLLIWPAHADPLEDAYKAGFAKGRKAGYAEGFADGSAAAGGAQSTAEVSQSGIVFPGTTFKTIIDGDNVVVSPDSSIAIIPNKAMGEIEQRLGKDFFSNHKVLLNNNLQP